MIESIFTSNRRCYGTYKIKVFLSNQGFSASHHKIGLLMKQRKVGFDVYSNEI